MRTLRYPGNLTRAQPTNGYILLIVPPPNTVLVVILHTIWDRHPMPRYSSRLAALVPKSHTNHVCVSPGLYPSTRFLTAGIYFPSYHPPGPVVIFHKTWDRDTLNAPRYSGSFCIRSSIINVTSPIPQSTPVLDIVLRRARRRFGGSFTYTGLVLIAKQVVE